MTTLDIERIKEDTKRLREAKERKDKERGYCTIPISSYFAVSDYWAHECYERHWTRLKPLLRDYAELVLNADEFIAIGKDDELKAILKELELLGYAKETAYQGKSTLYAVYISPMINPEKFNEGWEPAKYVQLIAKALKEYPYMFYGREAYDDGYKDGDYGDYDAYFHMKREELLQWQNVH